MHDLFHQVLTSRRNPRVRELLALRDDGGVRRRQNAYVLEGVKLIREALDGGADIGLAVISPQLQRTPSGAALLAHLTAAAVELLPVSDRVLAHVAHTRTPQGAVAVIRRRLPGGDLPPPRAGRPLLVAWQVQDPGNIGSLIRMADATGATGVVVAGGGADPYHPRAARAAAGALLRVEPVLMAPEAPLVQRLRGAGYELAAAAAGLGRDAAGFPWHGPWALIVGSEGHGLPPSLLSAVDHRVHVPMEAGAESLSVTAASAMLLYEAARRRRSGPAQRPGG